MGIALCLGLIIATMVVIWRASDGFETASELLGENLSDGVRGATINAIGSSMPELFTTLFFLVVLKETEGFAGGLGTTAGSAIFNGMIIPAVVILAVVGAGVVQRVNVSRKVLYRDGLSLLAAEAILIFLIGGTQLQWWHGAVLMLTYGAYVVILFRTMSEAEEGEEEDDDEDDESPDRSRFMSLLMLDLEHAIVGDKELTRARGWNLLVVSMIVIGAACLLLVKACEWMGAESFSFFGMGTFSGLNIPIIFVSVVLASAATSVPDTIISIRDARAGNYDDAVSNAIGSNIFDVCFALGLPLFLYTLMNGPIQLSADTALFSSELRTLLFGLTTVGIIIYLLGDGMGRGKAFLLLGLYFFFTLYIVGRSNGWDWADELANQVLSVNAALTGR